MNKSIQGKILVDKYKDVLKTLLRCEHNKRKYDTDEYDKHIVDLKKQRDLLKAQIDSIAYELVGHKIKNKELKYSDVLKMEQAITGEHKATTKEEALRQLEKLKKVDLV